MVYINSAEKVTANVENGEEWNIPHHGVYHPRKPDKLRVVFDCSSKYKDSFLNQHLLNGPDLTNGLPGIFMKFRRYPKAIMCDIEKMFHQIYIQQADREYLRFLWWENGDINSKPIVPHVCSFIRGNILLGCANYGLKYIARMQEESLPRASAFVRNDFYVDDGIASVETEGKAIHLIRDSRELC